MKHIYSLLVGLFLISFVNAQVQGGPDQYGYTWISDQAPMGPNYNWIDITVSGTQVTGLGDDNFVGPFGIGFAFQYYWTQETDLYVGSNGYLSFGSGIQISSQAIGFPTIPTNDATNNFIAPLMCDLTLGSSGNPGKVYIFSNNTDTCVISFLDVPFWNSASNYTGSNSFQVILDGVNNNIVFQYQKQTGTYDPAYSTATNPVVVGIENNSGTDGLQVSNTVLPAANTIYLFKYPDTVTFSVIDARPNWANNGEREGFFIVNDENFVLDANVENVGNTNISNSFTMNTTIEEAVGGLPSGVPIYNENFTVNGLNAGVDLDFSYGPFVKTNTASNYFVMSSVNLPVDINPGNDQLTTELVSLDTVGVNTVQLGFTDISIEGTYGIANEGAGIKYTPPFYPVDIQSIEAALIMTDVNLPNNSIKIEIFDDSGPAGNPGVSLFDTIIDSSAVLTITANAANQIVPVSGVTINSGSFYIVWKPDTFAQNTLLGTDGTAPFSRSTYEVIDDVFSPYRSEESEDYFLFANISVPKPSSLAPPKAAFSASTYSVCEGNSITFYDQTLNATSRAWTFDGGSPATSLNSSETVTFSTSGLYDITLVVTNASGTDSLTQQVNIAVSPVAAFFASTDTVDLGDEVILTNNSVNFNTVLWNFGDGNSAMNTNAQYTYNDTGSYVITLTVSNACGSDQLTQNIYVKDTTSPVVNSISETLSGLNISLSPNPASGEVIISSDEILETVVLYNPLGKEVMRWKVEQSFLRFNVSNLSSGHYILSIHSDNRFETLKILVE